MPTHAALALSLPIEMRVAGLGVSSVARLVRPDGCVVARAGMNVFDTEGEALIHADDARSRLLARVVQGGSFNFRSSYTLRAPDGAPLGEVASEPGPAFWRTAMTARMADAHAAPFRIRATSAVAEGISDFLGKLPLLGAAVDAVAKVRYEVVRGDAACVAVIDRMPSAIGECYSMRRTSRLTPEEQSFCALFMLVALALDGARSRGG
ncbi:hypothetical protein [Ottowia testudinis]|uniref:Uncharacterized protein n=1 Tax=Ottowia testudinis TaxID=2816950 RepID=A0A975CJA8_9BURK|nr:hypothetical protein [Ottowia testudinis]QTD46851.1 hypothetical protein J1M35_08255 [Ottowia testudinis]